MPADFTAAMARARDLVRAGKPDEATRLIQSTLAASASVTDAPAAARPRIDPAGLPDAEVVAAPRRTLGKVVDGLAKARRKPAPPVPGNFPLRSIDTPQGSRDYRLHVPASMPDGPQGLILMLHGCTQTPEDFAIGTRMNDHADRAGLIVAYPAQTGRHNPQNCWNWFRPGDQRRDAGEPAILAALARSLTAEFSIPPQRVFAAGLSAGGAMAAILGQAYPDLFSAIAVHSGLAAGSASDAMSAFAAMRGDAATPSANRAAPRTMTLHGTADATVHPRNSAQIMSAARPAGHRTVTDTGNGNGRAYTRTRTLAPDGTPLTEEYDIAGSGHAWSGGAAQGSHTDPKGPDASALIVAFFLAGT